MNDLAENLEENEDVQTEEVKAEKKVLDIINGRMPIPLVYLIRFDEGEAKDGDLAAKYKTSSGKVSDIRKNRNFAYVTDGMKFSVEDIAGAKAHLEKTTVGGNTFTEDEVASITGMLDTLPTSDTAAADLVAARKSTRKVKEAAPAEGGEEAGDDADDNEAADPDELDI